MELGEKIRLARMEAGLSQRKLCGDQITRNMLSQIEHGTARPSMDTLRYLAGQLGKPVSYFLEERAILSPNREALEKARQALASGRYGEVRELMGQCTLPDPEFEWERAFLSAASAIAGAEQAIQEGQMIYARELLEDGAQFCGWFSGMERNRLLLLGRIPGISLAEVVSGLPSLDEELLLRAEEAFSRGDLSRAEALLEAAENKAVPRWNLLRGQTLMKRGDYNTASDHLLRAEPDDPRRCAPLLEECFRELGDYKRAYEYACRQR